MVESLFRARDFTGTRNILKAILNKHFLMSLRIHF